MWPPAAAESSALAPLWFAALGEAVAWRSALNAVGGPMRLRSGGEKRVIGENAGASWMLVGLRGLTGDGCES